MVHNQIETGSLVNTSTHVLVLKLVTVAFPPLIGLLGGGLESSLGPRRAKLRRHYKGLSGDVGFSTLGVRPIEESSFRSVFTSHIPKGKQSQRPIDTIQPRTTRRPATKVFLVAAH